MDRLGALPGLRLVAVSPWFETAPIPVSEQPPYVNGVARLDGDPDPATLLAALHAIEAEIGRRRDTPDAARALDLDLIAIGDMVRDMPPPVLPHPRAHLRAFVLAPIVMIAAEWMHPRLHASAATLLAALPPQAIRLL